MSERINMTRKRPASEMLECNNNDTQTISRERKRRTTELRLQKQLQSDFTDKMIKPNTSPEGQRIGRSGRKIIPNESPPINQDCKQMIQQSIKPSKRKSQPNDKCNNTITTIDELGSPLLADNSKNINETATDEKQDACNEIASIQYEAVDYEKQLKTYHLVRPMDGIDSGKIIEEIDLISLTDGSDNDDEYAKTHSQQPISMPVSQLPSSEPDSTSSPNTTHSKTDTPKPTEVTNFTDVSEVTDITEVTSELTNISNPISDCAVSTSESDAILMNEKPYSECTSDDCIIADDDEDDSSENWHVGQLVWAALKGSSFWPALIFNHPDKHIFRADNQIHVKFLSDNGRYNWVNEKAAILPFKGRKEFIEKSELACNKRNKAYKRISSRSWMLGVLEANVLQCIKLMKRITFYDKILVDAMHEMIQEIRSNRRKSDVRCDTPQTFDTAYSSMKQSVSPASLSPTLNELDRNYDVDKNINNYLKSVELSRPEELPEEDLQIDEPTSYAVLADSSSSIDHIYCRLVKLVYDKLKENGSPIDQTAITNENLFMTNLNELWSELTSVNHKSSLSRSVSLKRLSRKLSCDSAASNSTTATTPNQTKRQRSLAVRKAETEKQMAQKQMEIAQYNNYYQDSKSKTKEQLQLEKQQKIDDEILSFCMKKYPANFLFKGLSKDPVCQCCLQRGTVLKCAGPCNGYFHKHCLSKEVKRTEYNAILKQKMLADDEDSSTSTIKENVHKLECVHCTTAALSPPCFVCTSSDGDIIRCCERNCGKAYHIDCLNYWPQNKKTYESDRIKTLYCPRHVCHTCVSPHVKLMFQNTEADKKLIKCLQCPGTYHRSGCIPAGSELLSESQLICPRHLPNIKRINIDYCAMCSTGGSLVCCDACAYAFHLECLKVPVGDHYICEECESGLRPLYGDLVWCKYSRKDPWWPGIIVPTPCIPDRVYDSNKEPNHICIYFFRTHNYGWVAHTQIYLYAKGDGEFKGVNDKELLKSAMDEAEKWKNRFEEISNKNNKGNPLANKPPPYRKIKTNRILARFKESEYTECSCCPNDPAPCGPDSNCVNPLTFVECDPDLCPAKDKCQNQNFHRGEQYSFQVQWTESKGWGLFAKEEIPPEKFVIEYMGEVIDSSEFDQRFKRSFANKDDNYYFLTLGNPLYIDAAAFGNEARFINHSCEPNVKPMKWTVYSNGQGQLRVGFFAKRTILPGEEITFDYHWGTNSLLDKTATCYCGSKKCKGSI